MLGFDVLRFSLFETANVRTARVKRDTQNQLGNKWVLHDPSVSIVFRLANLAHRRGPDHATAAERPVPQVRVPSLLY